MPPCCCPVKLMAAASFRWNLKVGADGADKRSGLPYQRSASEELERTAELMDKVSRRYDELISYADLYDSANFEAKKMIVNQLIRRVDVYRGYQINISFNFDLTPYIEGE